MILREVWALTGILKNVTAGSDTAKRGWESTGRLVDAMVTRKLQGLEVALVAALAEVRALRTVFDDSYEPSPDELNRALGD